MALDYWAEMAESMTMLGSEMLPDYVVEVLLGD